MTRPLIAGNWKMFGFKADLEEVEALRQATGAASQGVDIAVCLPATLIAPAATRGFLPITLGGQDCHPGREGAHTGDLSAAQLADAGAQWVIVGHSERRRDHGETDALVRAKALAAARADLTPIVCVGETIEERQAGETSVVVRRQLQGSLPDDAPHGFVIAYEPVWAIGTGLTPTPREIAETHDLIHQELAGRFGASLAARVLYGGSVKPANAREIFSVDGVDGALVGGASLKADDFAAIVLAHPASNGPEKQGE